MAYLAICGLIAFLSGFLCALFVFFNKPRNPLKTMWGLYSLGISLWGFGVFKLFTTNDGVEALFWGRLINFIVVCVPIFFFHFVVQLTNRWESKRVELILYYTLIFAYLITGSIYPQLFISSVSPKGEFLFYPDAGVLFYLFPIIFFFLMTYGLVMLHRSQQKASPLRRNQYKYLFISSLLAVLGGGTMLFWVFNIPVYPYGAITVPLYNLIVAYSIVKYQLLDIRIVIRRGLVYTILIGTLTVFYMVTIFILGHISKEFFGYTSTIGSLAVFVVIAIIFVPLKDYIQSFIDRRFFQASYQEIVEQNDLLKQQVLRAQRYETMSSLSRHIVMELKNPVSILSDYGRELPKRMEDIEFLEKFKDVYEKEMARIQVLFDRLSEFTDPKPLHLEPMDLISLVKEAVVDIQQRVKGTRTDIYTYFSEYSPVILNLDAEQIKQALHKLLMHSKNSINEEGGQIWVGIEKSEDIWEIRIKDTGRGLSPDEITRLFDPFSELSLAQAIINHHGGKVIVDSEKGVGTEWVVQLPTA